MSLGLFNCRLIQPTGDQLFFLSAVLPHRCQFGQALFSLLVARPARPRPAGGRRMLLAFPSQKDFAWFSAGAKSRRRQKSSLPPIHPRIFPKIHLTLPIDSAIEPDVVSRPPQRLGIFCAMNRSRTDLLLGSPRNLANRSRRSRSLALGWLSLRTGLRCIALTHQLTLGAVDTHTCQSFPRLGPLQAEHVYRFRLT